MGTTIPARSDSPGPKWGLRPRILALLLLSGLALVVTVQFVGQEVVLRGFRRAENDAATASMKMAKTALDAKVAAIDVLAGDWASSEETQRFIEDRRL